MALTCALHMRLMPRRARWQVRGQNAEVLEFGFSAGMVISGSGDETLKLCSLDSGSFMKTLTIDSACVLCVSVDFSVGMATVESYDNTLKLWCGMSSGRCVFSEAAIDCSWAQSCVCVAS